jgi:hypothetical protein
LITSGRAGLDRVDLVLLLPRRRQDQHRHRWVVLDQRRGHLYPVHRPDLQVQDRHLGRTARARVSAPVPIHALHDSRSFAVGGHIELR